MTRPSCAVLLAVGLAVSCAGRQGVTQVQPTASTARQTAHRDTHEKLDGVLWMQTAAEYWALASSAYKRAEASLTAALSDKSWTAALEQTAGYEQLPAAVIMDLDETVLDNSAFDGQLVIDRTPFLDTTWDAWMETTSAGLIPGAKGFIDTALARGVRVFFITNRTAVEEKSTLANLAKHGLQASGETVLSTGENNWTSDKTARRAEVAKSHRVLLLIGDDLNDFASATTLGIEQRMKLATQHAARWERQWVLIPNGIYGSWERAITSGAKSDEEALARKRRIVKGFR